VKYFKNTELAKLHNVSEKSVRNWIQAASEGKLDLQLYEQNGKSYIANISSNSLLLEELAAKGKKYKNTRGHKALVPSPKFYKLFSPKQIVDIISNLDIHREIPLQYSYFNSGAKRWDQYTRHLLAQNTQNSLTNTIQLLELSMDYIDTLIEGYDSVNVVDIGVGNALPVRKTLEHLLQKNVLKRYVGLDISQELLKIAEHNIAHWFDGKVQTEMYVRDVNYDRFDDLLIPESHGTSAESTVNLVFFLGGTINNFRDPGRVYSTIHDSMGKKDLLFFSKKLDTAKSRRYFEMAVRGNQELDLVLKVLNIDESMYTIEQFFDEYKMARQLQVRLNIALTITFNLYGQERTLELNKGDAILLWRARHQTTIETLCEFDKNNFDLLHATRSKDQEYLLSISRIKTTTP